jgi:phosphatidylserine/phosphatidylglycerophosphate/cardiolipin synthase-like enzyme
MIEPHFGDIRNIILEHLGGARYDIYVAVAWFTDRELFDLIVQKVKQGLNVELILIKDHINLNNSFNYNNFVENGGKLFWDDHHHKFCVIDREVVITGSYNWTYKASNRVKRENIIVIKHEKELIDKYSFEFRKLQKNADRLKIEPKIEILERKVEVEKRIEVEVEKIIENTIFISRKENLLLKTHNDRINWWRQLNKEWKRIFSIILKKNIIIDTPTKNELIELFQLTSLDLSSFNIENIEPLCKMGNLQTIKFSELSNSNKQKLKKELVGIKLLT